MGPETELKLLCSPDVLARVGRHPAVRAVKSGRARTDRLMSRYFDTPERALGAAGLALRVRRTSRRWEQTLKAEGDGIAGMQVRPEWNWELPDDSLAPELLIGTPAAKALGGRKQLEGNAAGLRPIFETDFSRTIHPLDFGDDTRAELCLDRGEVRAGRRSRPVCEVEMELLPRDHAQVGAESFLTPDPAAMPGRLGVSTLHPTVHLFRLARALLDSLPLRPGYMSKAQRAMSLVGAPKPAPSRANPAMLSPGMTLAEAFRAIATACMHQLQANESGMLVGRDPEYLHQMRVALRRLRSAFAVFRSRIPAELLDPVEAEARALARRLGTARDWDVLCGETLWSLDRALDPNFTPETFKTLRSQASRARTRYGRDAREAVSSVEYSRAVLRLAELLASSDSFIDHRPESLPVFAARMLQARYQKLCKFGGRVATLSEAELHVMRIRAKKLRYAAEFFGALFVRRRDQRSARRVRKFVRALSRLQAVLGALNDVIMGQSLVNGLLESRQTTGLPESQRSSTRTLGNGRASDERPLVGERALARAGEAQYATLNIAGKFSGPSWDRMQGILSGWFAAHRTTQLAALPAAWSAFDAQSRFWKQALPPRPRDATNGQAITSAL